MKQENDGRDPAAKGQTAKLMDSTRSGQSPEKRVASEKKHTETFLAGIWVDF